VFQEQHAEAAPVTVVGTVAEADLLVATLGVAGIDAHALSAIAYPSLDWVEGVAVTVQLGSHTEASELVAGLGHRTVPRPSTG
jgi:hypothetical protein